MRPRELRFTVPVFLFVACLVAAETRAEETLIGFGKAAVWKYQDEGAEPSEDWRKPDFDDGSWKSGPAPLGYGDPGLGTKVGYGDDPKDKHLTTHFRHAFEVKDADAIETLVLLIRSDDGCVVYLNGDEIIRSNMPEGDVACTTTATRALSLLDERLYRRHVVPAESLSEGRNVLAVELHQANPRSTDLYLDIVLRGCRGEQELHPVLVPRAKEATVAYHRKHYVGPGMRIPDGYLDGGRGMKLSEDGIARSGREILVVDRERDARLRTHLNFARCEGVRALEPLERAKLLAAYVDFVMSENPNGVHPMKATGKMADEYEGDAVLIGNVPRICGAGVCRHRSLLFKLLGDEAGLKVALIRGNYGDGETSGGHAWNELFLDGGRRVLVDVTLGRVAIEMFVPRRQPNESTVRHG